MKIGLAAMAACMMASPALAATTDNPFSADSTVLDLRGIDLATVDGQQRLEIRMDQAADAVCGTGMSKIHLSMEAQTRECRSEVMADIRSQIATATASRTVKAAPQVARLSN